MQLSCSFTVEICCAHCRIAGAQLVHAGSCCSSTAQESRAVSLTHQSDRTVPEPQRKSESESYPQTAWVAVRWPCSKNHTTPNVQHCSRTCLYHSEQDGIPGWLQQTGKRHRCMFDTRTWCCSGTLATQKQPPAPLLAVSAAAMLHTRQQQPGMRSFMSKCAALLHMVCACAGNRAGSHLTPASPTMPMAIPAARPARPQDRPEAR